jgi:hypothetical protein
MVTWSVNHLDRIIKPDIFRKTLEAFCSFSDFARSRALAWSRAAHFFIAGSRDDVDLIVQRSANRPSDFLGCAAALAKIAL